MMIKHEMLRHFVALAETGSLVAAADKVGRSPSAISMSVKHLQDSLGAPLFASDRKAQLSALGIFVLEQAKAELAHFSAMERAITRFAATGGGLIRVAAVPSVAGAVMPAAIKAFVALFPDVQIDLRDMESGAVVQGLQNGAFDIGIATAPAAILREGRQPLCKDPYGIMCAADHPLAALIGPVGWEVLRDHVVIAYPLASTLCETAARSMQATLTAHNTLSLLALVQSGVGVTVSPRMVTQLAWAPVAFLGLKDQSAYRQIDIMLPPKSTPSVATTAFIACLHTALPASEDAFP